LTSCFAARDNAKGLRSRNNCGAAAANALPSAFGLRKATINTKGLPFPGEREIAFVVFAVFRHFARGPAGRVHEQEI
jgi:hypothetical protein